MTKSRIQGTF